MKHRLPLIGALALLVAGTSLPEARTVSCGDARRPVISTSFDGRTRFTRVDLLTYNIEGLPWPARKNRTPFLRQIGRRLSALRAKGQAPDIIVFQEAFSSAASQAILASGYPSIVTGPDRRAQKAPNEDGALPGKRRILKGEIRPNLYSSGLVIATDYPIVASNARPYARGSCAGYDCLSNKGMLFAEIAIPGVPGTIDVFTTHMQAQKASKVASDRYHEAHARQTNELSAFAQANGNLSSPTLIAGDFNMRNAEIRHYKFERKLPMESVHRFCTDRQNRCNVLQEWPNEDQFRRVQDMQFFLSGDLVKIRPITVEGMFDGGPSGPVLSDHDGFRVVYELSWPVQGDLPAPACPI
jgi:endonuclease/exonuclease/phosphatase family metal-dependent hydrolase